MLGRHEWLRAWQLDMSVFAYTVLVGRLGCFI